MLAIFIIWSQSVKCTVLLLILLYPSITKAGQTSPFNAPLAHFCTHAKYHLSLDIPMNPIETIKTCMSWQENFCGEKVQEVMNRPQH